MKKTREINPRIIEIGLTHYLKMECLIYQLYSVYFDIEMIKTPSFGGMEERILNKIYHTENGKVVWDIPLFINEPTSFDWVKDEYVPMFKNVNNNKGGKIRESVKRMKKFFSENPEIRKEDVLCATSLYLSETNPSFIQDPHYFIYKGSGTMMTSTLLDFVDKYNEIKKSSHIVNDITKRIQ